MMEGQGHQDGLPPGQFSTSSPSRRLPRLVAPARPGHDCETAACWLAFVWGPWAAFLP